MGAGKGGEAAKFILNFSSKTNFSEEVRDTFIADVDVLFKRVCRGYGRNTQMGTVLRGILGIVRDHKVAIDSNYATLVLNALCLDGLGYQILPSYNVLDGAKPYFEFYRLTKKTVGVWLFRALIPFSRWHKRRADASFFQSASKKEAAAKAEQKHKS